MATWDAHLHPGRDAWSSLNVFRTPRSAQKSKMRESFAPVQRNAMPTAPARAPALISKVVHTRWPAATAADPERRSVAYNFNHLCWIGRLWNCSANRGGLKIMIGRLTLGPEIASWGTQISSVVLGRLEWGPGIASWSTQISPGRPKATLVAATTPPAPSGSAGKRAGCSESRTPRRGAR